jgi:hypothetical protein
MTRTRIALTAGVAAIVTAALIATSGSAHGPSWTKLNLVATEQADVGFGPQGQPQQGDRVGFGDTITGDDTGFDRGTCTIIGAGQTLCTIEEQLSNGTLTIQGVGSLTEPANKRPMAVTGGTGAYDGARGTAFVTTASATRTEIKVRLLR